VFFVFNALFFVPIAKASEADINLPDLTNIYFSLFGSNVSGIAILNVGLLICIIGLFLVLFNIDKQKSPRTYINAFCFKYYWEHARPI